MDDVYHAALAGSVRVYRSAYSALLGVAFGGIALVLTVITVVLIKLFWVLLALALVGVVMAVLKWTKKGKTAAAAA